jgi:hypothetical protein
MCRGMLPFYINMWLLSFNAAQAGAVAAHPVRDDGVQCQQSS